MSHFSLTNHLAKFFNFIHSFIFFLLIFFPLFLLNYLSNQSGISCAFQSVQSNKNLNPIYILSMWCTSIGMLKLWKKFEERAAWKSANCNFFLMIFEHWFACFFFSNSSIFAYCRLFYCKKNPWDFRGLYLSVGAQHFLCLLSSTMYFCLF